MAVSVTVVSPAVNSEIGPPEILTADVVGGNAWIAAQFGGSGAIEVVHDGDDFAPRYALSTIAPITGGGRYAIRRTGGWPAGVVTLRYYEVTGGDGVAPPLVDKEINVNNTGDECVAFQLPIDTDLCPTVLAVKLTIAGGTSGGTATFRAYIGGNHQYVDEVYDDSGTFVGAVNTSNPIELLEINGTPITNPGGPQYITLTYQSAPGQSVTKYGATGVVA